MIRKVRWRVLTWLRRRRRRRYRNPFQERDVEWNADRELATVVICSVLIEDLNKRCGESCRYIHALVPVYVMWRQLSHLWRELSHTNHMLCRTQGADEVLGILCNWHLGFWK
ncbi:uncharacterized protein EI97DRAFT_304792 [Westerdykella ornata]|uniref:Uncharacterized protein n=1 Tax=Westerdykella ornata TaxID=318751 RepID=A0A6A6JK03_WESOR|nr:uncharacterized protein EI97DRAFT_304792 [Westerdykella ornata]KAF2276970.1 hypothetical protein EI97DRAFT_304792 [Westerdykella ornata]